MTVTVEAYSQNNHNKNIFLLTYSLSWLGLRVPVATRSKAYVCGGRSPAETVGSNPAGCMDTCLLCVLCVVGWRSLRRTDHSYSEVLPTVVRRRV